MYRHFTRYGTNRMDLCIIAHYREKYPGERGKDLTDRCVQYLAGRIYPEIDPETVRIVRTDAGKPSIEWDEAQNPPSISISHCGDLFACAFDEENVGIDIQNERRVDTQRLSSRYFTEAEQRYIGGDADRFYTVWTRKEAFSKYTGVGLQQILAGEEVVERTDVAFQDFIIDTGNHSAGVRKEVGGAEVSEAEAVIYCSICTSAERANEIYEIQFFD